MKRTEQSPRQTMIPLEPHAPPRRRVASEAQTSVLLVEEDGDDATVCQYLLEREGLTVLRARTRREGADIACQQQPQLVVVDATLSDGGGYELAMELKLMPALAQVPVVGLSAFSSHSEAPEPPPDVFAAFLTKPIRREAFSRTIRDLLATRTERSVKQRRDRPLRMDRQG